MKLLSLFFILFVTCIGFAQDMQVNGSVLDGDNNKEPLAFANIRVKGLDIDVETSMEGVFELNLLEGNYTFIIDFIGYEPVEIDNVIVSKDHLTLSPVVLSALRPTYDVAVVSNEN